MHAAHMRVAVEFLVKTFITSTNCRVSLVLISLPLMACYFAVCDLAQEYDSTMFLGKLTYFSNMPIVAVFKTSPQKVWAGRQPPVGLGYFSALCLVPGKKSGTLDQRFLTFVSPDVGGLLEKTLKSCWGSTRSCRQCKTFLFETF